MNHSSKPSLSFNTGVNQLHGVLRVDQIRNETLVQRPNRRTAKLDLRYWAQRGVLVEQGPANGRTYRLHHQASSR